MTASIAALFRYPIKGFTPEKRQHARLEAGKYFPADRLYAVEDGPSGFDVEKPGFIPKMKFTVLAKIAEVAAARTEYDEATGILRAEAAGQTAFQGDLTGEAGRAAFARWLGDLLGDNATGPLQVLDGRGHRFTDHPLGFVSVINLSSVRDLEAKVERPVDPLRFRGNVYVEGWPAWAENDWPDREITLGTARAKIYKPIVRCAATDVDPATALRDMDLPADLHRLYGHLFCGVYLHITEGGDIAVGDAVSEAL
ncbi:MAG: MOSC domain-containing protein [Caulobacteraceae bacterium]